MLLAFLAPFQIKTFCPEHVSAYTTAVKLHQRNSSVTKAKEVAKANFSFFVTFILAVIFFHTIIVFLVLPQRSIALIKNNGSCTQIKVLPILKFCGCYDVIKLIE